MFIKVDQIVPKEGGGTREVETAINPSHVVWAERDDQNKVTFLYYLTPTRLRQLEVKERNNEISNEEFYEKMKGKQVRVTDTIEEINEKIRRAKGF